MLQHLLWSTIKRNFSGKNKQKRLLTPAYQQLILYYFGHGVIFEIKSSTPMDSPRTTSIEPRPFHNDVRPWCWCKLYITGTNVNGTRWYDFELLCTWHCLRRTTNGWLKRFSAIALTAATPVYTYFLTDLSKIFINRKF